MSDLILDGYIRSSLETYRYGITVQQDILAMLHKLEASIIASIQNDQDWRHPRTQFQKERLDALLEQAHQDILDAVATVESYMRDGMASLATIESIRGVGIVWAGLGIDLAATVMSPAQARALAGKLMIEGTPAADWWKSLGDSTQQALADAIRLGVARGETTPQIVQRVYGKGKDGVGTVGRDVFGNMRHNAMSVVRTSVQTVANSAHLETFKLNDDVIEGIQWLSTLDNRTTPICRTLDGMRWTLDFEPIDDALAFPGPTAHWGCRSTQIPFTFTWQQLAKKFGGDEKTASLFDDEPKGERASLFGPVDRRTTFADWLDGLSPKKAVEAMGGDKRLMRQIQNGRDPLSVLPNIKPLDMSEMLRTVEEIMSRNPAIEQAVKDVGALDDLRKKLT